MRYKDEREDVYSDRPLGRSRIDRESRARADREQHRPWRPEEYPRDTRFGGVPQYRGEYGEFHSAAHLRGDDAGQGDYEEQRYRETRPSFRGQGPKNYSRSDERIRDEVCDRLTEDHDIDASDIDVEVKMGEVTLIGTVENRRMKHFAEDCIANVSGVRDVHNRLKTRGRSGGGN